MQVTRRDVVKLVLAAPVVAAVGLGIEKRWGLLTNVKASPFAVYDFGTELQPGDRVMVFARNDEWTGHEVEKVEGSTVTFVQENSASSEWWITA